MRSIGHESGFALAFTKVGEALGRYAGTERNAQQICELIALRPPAQVLDVACGGGRYAAALHRLGHHVTAFDLSVEQIEYARAYNPGPAYLVADMREPPGGPYDLILNAYSSFGFLESEEEDLSALRAWNEKLQAGGWLVMELSDLTRARHRYGSSGGTVVFDQDGAHEAYSMDWRTNIVTITQEVKGIGRITVRKRMYSSERLQDMLQSVGFVDVRIFGSFSGSPRRPEDRAVFTARRR